MKSTTIKITICLVLFTFAACSDINSVLTTQPQNLLDISLDWGSARSVTDDPLAQWAKVEAFNSGNTQVGEATLTKVGTQFKGNISVSENTLLRFEATVGSGATPDTDNALYAGFSSHNVATGNPVTISVSRSKTLSFDANGGTGTMSFQTRNINSTSALPDRTVSRTGYVFRYWAQDSVGNGTIKTNKENYTMGVKDATLYAQWKQISFGTKQTNPFSLQIVNNGYAPGVQVYATPTLVDIDNDGDLDLFSGELFGLTRFFLNTTTNSATPTFAAPITNTFGIGTISNKSRITFADLNGDGIKDALIGNEAGYFYWYRNDGSVTAPSFTALTLPNNPLNGRTPADGAAPAFADLDGDGDLDLLAGQWQGIFYYFENTGTSTAPAFPASGTVNPFGLVALNTVLPDQSGYSHPTFGDLDLDGDFDLITGSSAGNLYFFENTGTKASPAFAAPVKNPFGLTGLGVSQSTPYLVNFDGDSDLDLFVGGIDGNIYYYENTTFSNVAE